MNRIPRSIAFVFFSLTMVASTVAFAGDTDNSIVEEKVRALVPTAKTVAISETPITGLLQVQINSDIVYVTEDADYLIQGQIMEMDSRVNLTDQAKSTIRQGLMKDLNTDELITFAPEDSKYELTVFTDIDCGYCRKLHSQIEEYNKDGITIHYMAFPRAGVGSESYDKFVSVWCAADQKSALTLAKNGVDPEPMTCKNPIEEQYELGREIGVTGTPQLVTPDGTLIPGYMPPDQLRARLESLAAASAEPAADASE
jgi:thiol:disulfide interchange protein DsbC